MKHLRKILAELELSKENILKSWIEADVVERILSEHIAPEYFKEIYAHGIFEYFIEILRGEKEVGDCPIMRQFLNHCSIEGLQVTDVYLICINFRHAMIEYLVDDGKFNNEIYKELNAILDNNLTGVLDVYNQLLQSKETTIANKSLWINQYQKIIDDALIVSKTNPNGAIIYANDNFCKISGYTRSELIGKNHNIVRHPDMPSINYKKMWDTIKAKKVWSGVFKNRAKDGSEYFVGTVIFPIVDKDNNVLEYLSTRTDLTEVFTLQQEKEKTQKLIMEQSVLAEMGDMINAISHQWKQPLSVITALVNDSLLRNEMERVDSDADLQNFKEIQTMVDHLSETIDSFRGFYRLDKSKSIVSMSNLFKKIKLLVNASLKQHGIALNVKEENLFSVVLIEQELIQVILVIINNAIDALLEASIKDAMISVSFAIEGDYGLIDIQDNGMGIQESMLPNKLFELYSTSKSNGTGVGLHLSKRIVEQHLGGEIYAMNGEHGAKFTIKLPLA